MMILYVLIAVLYAVLWVASVRFGDCPGDRSGFGRMAEYAYIFLRKKGMCQSREVREGLCAVCPEMEAGRQEEHHLREYYVKKLRFVLLMVFMGNLSAACLCIAGRLESSLEEGRYIDRNSYGLGSEEADLRAEITGGEKKSEEFRIVIEEQQYEEAVIRKMAEEVRDILPDAVLGSNVSLEEVRSDLNLPDSVEGYPFRITWESDNYARIYSDGSVMNEGLEKGGEAVRLTAILSCGTYREELMVPVHVYPPMYSQDELLRRKIYEALVEQEKADRSRKEIRLPEKVDGKTLIWSRKQEDSSGYLLFLAGIGAAAMYLSGDKELRKKVSRRNRQMLSDYPQLVTRFILYLGAGMTMRNAFRKIAFDYKKEREEGGHRYVYEEMLLTCHQLDSGISEALAYEHFGKRCRLPQYNKFANLLAQGLKKGSSGLLEELRHESKIAFEDRRNLAKKLGEEAGTTLLLPMMLMLGIVMVLIMIPAYFSFSI